MNTKENPPKSGQYQSKKILLDSKFQVEFRRLVNLFNENNGKGTLNSSPANYEILASEIGGKVKGKFLCELYHYDIPIGKEKMGSKERIEATMKFLKEYEFREAEKDKTKDVGRDVSEALVNRALAYTQYKIGLAFQFSDDVEIVFESFTSDDLNSLKRLRPLVELVGEIDWELIKGRLELKKDIVQGLKLVSEIDEPSILGFFILYPITNTCAVLCENGRLLKSDQFKEEHICNDYSTASAIYVSWVIALDYNSRPYLMAKFKEELRGLLKKHPKIDKVYIRPGTDDGKKQARRNKFMQLPNSPTLYYQTRSKIIAS